MRQRWPETTAFSDVVLHVEQEVCTLCQHRLNVCDHRIHRLFSLKGPLKLVCKLAHCPDPCCPGHHRTLSPLAEAHITLPWWLIAWDLFCWLGFRRFSRHWSIPQLRAELFDNYQVRLSEDAISGYLQRYRIMVAARHQDATLLAEAYKDMDRLVLTIDGLQPEKGHETLYVVRELRGKRVWFAEALLSSSADEVRRLIAKAKDWAQQLGKPVALWMSDKQDAFVSGIAAEFPDVPHRYCQNHFLRDLAKPVLEADSHAKVQMRKKVRGLRDIERQVLEDRRGAEAEAVPVSGSVVTTKEAQVIASSSNPLVAAVESATSEAAAVPAALPTLDAAPSLAAAVSAVHPPAGGEQTVKACNAEAGQVVLDYCCAVRGILNDDQGGPLQPPGLRMAEALQQVRASLSRVLAAKKGGAATSNCSGSRAASTGDCRPLPRSRSRSRSRSKK